MLFLVPDLTSTRGTQALLDLADIAPGPLLATGDVIASLGGVPLAPSLGASATHPFASGSPRTTTDMREPRRQGDVGPGALTSEMRREPHPRPGGGPAVTKRRRPAACR